MCSSDLEAGLAPQHKASQLSDEQLEALSHALLDIPRLSYTTLFRSEALSHALLDIPRLSYNTRGVADENTHHGALFRFKVFHRAGKKCERCGGIIDRIMLSSRPFYWCPHCQK